MAEPWAVCTSWATVEFLHNQHIDTAQKNRLSVGRKGFTAENNSPGLPLHPLLYLEVSFRKLSKPQNKVLIAELLIKAPEQPR